MTDEPQRTPPASGHPAADLVGEPTGLPHYERGYDWDVSVDPRRNRLNVTWTIGVRLYEFSREIETLDDLIGVLERLANYCRQQGIPTRDERLRR